MGRLAQLPGDRLHIGGRVAKQKRAALRPEAIANRLRQRSIVEQTLSDLQAGRISVGPALHGFRGVLTGVPILDGGEALMKDDPES